MSSQRKTLICLIVCFAVVLGILIGALAIMLDRGVFSADTPTTQPTTMPTEPTTEPTTQPTTMPTEPTTEPTTVPTEPPVYKLGTASIASVGDFLMHLPVINSADVQDGIYDFSSMFTYFGDYVAGADYAVGNLETTLAGTAYPYKGYPQFNCPDGIVSSVQAAGFDMLLTANNHSYDTYSTGFLRTQQVIREFGMAHLGTVEDSSQPYWQVVEINGIKIGMICYTYETEDDPEKKALNGIPMNAQCAPLIATFSYAHLDTFYEEMQVQIAQMEEAGAEAIMLYIHWGNEYETRNNATQSAMAQELCDLGVDVIVGGHPHVVQPVQLLTSRNNAEEKTVCIYSLGNIVSNQRREHMDLKTGHTEDGLMATVTFAKYSDGTVILEAVKLLPTWVDLYEDAARGKPSYAILPLDSQVEDWQTAFALTEERLALAQASYARTMAIVGEGLQTVQNYLAQLVWETETALGIA